jgi:hypothetical protein
MLSAGFTNLFQIAIRYDGILNFYLPTIVKLAIRLKFIKLNQNEIDEIQNLYQQNNKYQTDAYLIELADRKNPNLLKPLGACYICFNTYLAFLITTITTTQTNLKFYDPIITPLISIIFLEFIYANKNK